LALVALAFLLPLMEIMVVILFLQALHLLAAVVVGIEIIMVYPEVLVVAQAQGMEVEQEQAALELLIRDMQVVLGLLMPMIPLYRPEVEVAQVQ
jgi:hypothetical protein